MFSIADRFKMYHLGRVVFLIGCGYFLQGRSGYGRREPRFFRRRLLVVPLRGRVWGTVVPQVVGSNHITYLSVDAAERIWVLAMCVGLHCPGADSCVRLWR